MKRLQGSLSCVAVGIHLSGGRHGLLLDLSWSVAERGRSRGLSGLDIVYLSYQKMMISELYSLGTIGIRNNSVVRLDGLIVYGGSGQEAYLQQLDGLAYDCGAETGQT